MKIPFKELTNKFSKIYNNEMLSLNVAPPDIQPKATDHIDDMILMIEKLIKNMKHFSMDDIGGINFVSDIHSIKHENLRTRIYLS